MKLKNIFAAAVVVPALLLAACNDEDSNWNAGPEAENVNQVYFNQAISEAEIEPNTPAEFTVRFYRQDNQGAISVPLTVEGSDLFEVPAMIDFADGESSVEVTVPVAASEVSGLHECTITIPDGIYSSPYTRKYTTYTLRVSIIQWLPYAENASVYGYDFSNKNVDPTMPAYTTTLYKADGMDRYYVMIGDRKMVFNTVASDALDDGVYYIYPMGGFTGTDYGSAAWFFAEGSDESCKIHWPGTDGYLDYCLIYLGEDSDDCTVFNANRKRICLYICTDKYDASGNYTGYAYEFIYIDWSSVN